jgi:predicted trehalose synthase
MQRRCFTQTAPLGQRLEEQAKRLRREAKGIYPGIEREKLIRRARQAETASQIDQWVSSKGLKTPS